MLSKDLESCKSVDIQKSPADVYWDEPYECRQSAEASIYICWDQYYHS